MLVSELIEKLKQYPPDMEVIIWESWDPYTLNESKVREVKTHTYDYHTIDSENTALFDVKYSSGKIIKTECVLIS